ncbi:MAG: hypothetical protein CSA55_00930 [Ilumatobacter coccineus]|uniref:Uncharacterized protein n=1 Tax=Ilumatobacter coccineus TaxID=467094 RepID=A0A2G6KFK9_9ACTN|nr:MAG: hypothetical protein CSA55_00930 [Ilumatobacter coccineus]
MRRLAVIVVVALAIALIASLVVLPLGVVIILTALYATGGAIAVSWANRRAEPPSDDQRRADDGPTPRPLSSKGWGVHSWVTRRNSR